MEVRVNLPKILKSWQLSLYSFEWMTKDGSIKPAEALSETDRAKREKIEADLASGTSIEKPVLGLGIQDNVEIGSGRAALLTLAAHGVTEIPVHIFKSNERDFKAFLA
jgi:hypothetical protein